MRGRSAGAGVAVLMLLAGCAGGGDDGAGGGTETSTSATAGDGRAEIAAALEDESPGIVAAVRDPATTLTPVPVAALGRWRILDVEAGSGATPRRWYIALSEEGEAVVLSGFPDRWGEILDGAFVEDSDEAVELATVHADATRDMTTGYQRVDSFDDIRFVPAPGTKEQAEIADLRSRYDRIAPPEVTGSGPWSVRLWTVVGTALVRQDLVVSPDGSVLVRTARVATGLPVPVSP